MSADLNLIVVDASVVLKWQLDDEECISQALSLREDFYLKRSCQLIAPHLLIYEIINGILVAARKKRISSEQVSEITINLLSMGILLKDIDPISVLELALRHNISAYDAAYLSLAKSEHCELLTGDKKLWESVKDKQLKWIGDYSN
jgi:predicted nucleic acid-binding protein